MTESDEQLLTQLGVDTELQEPAENRTREERVTAGFEEIQRFAERCGREPSRNAENDIFERLLAVRLARIRSRDDLRALLAPLDRHQLLDVTGDAAGDVTGAADGREVAEREDDEQLLAQLDGAEGGDAGEDAGQARDGKLTTLSHVRSRAEKRAAGEIANREPCADFAEFKPMFERAQSDLESGLRATRPFVGGSKIERGDWFIVGGQKAYVAEVGRLFRNLQDKQDARLRVIFDNGTESNLLLRSLERALYRDPAARRIDDFGDKPLFAANPEAGDAASGTIYVLRSLSDLPEVRQNRELLHKIGVTGGSVEKRIANASQEPTFLLAEVEVVSAYQLFNVDRSKLENLIHRIFGRARAAIEILDRFGKPFVPREWFLVPLFAIDEAVQRIRDGSIKGRVYDPATASLVEARRS